MTYFSSENLVPCTACQLGYGVLTMACSVRYPASAKGSLTAPCVVIIMRDWALRASISPANLRYKSGIYLPPLQALPVPEWRAAFHVKRYPVWPVAPAT